MEFITKALLENKGVLPLVASESLPQAEIVTAVAFLRAGGSAAQLSIRFHDLGIDGEARISQLKIRVMKILASLSDTGEVLGARQRREAEYVTYTLTREVH